MDCMSAGARSVARDREDVLSPQPGDCSGRKDPAEVTVAGLCDHLEVTKGSFYHHFEDMPAFVEAFSARWQNWIVHRFGRYGTELDPVRRLDAMANTSFQDMTPGHSAIRAWARTNPAVAKAMPAMHGSAKDAAAGAVIEFGEDEYTAERACQPDTDRLHRSAASRPEAQQPERYLRTIALVYDAMGFDFELLHRAGRTRLHVMSWQRLRPGVRPGPGHRPLDAAHPAGDRPPADQTSVRPQAGVLRGGMEPARRERIRRPHDCKPRPTTAGQQRILPVPVRILAPLPPATGRRLGCARARPHRPGRGRARSAAQAGTPARRRAARAQPRRNGMAGVGSQQPGGRCGTATGPGAPQAGHRDDPGPDPAPAGERTARRHDTRVGPRTPWMAPTTHAEHTPPAWPANGCAVACTSTPS